MLKEDHEIVLFAGVLLMGAPLYFPYGPPHLVWPVGVIYALAGIAGTDPVSDHLSFERAVAGAFLSIPLILLASWLVSAISSVDPLPLSFDTLSLFAFLPVPMGFALGHARTRRQRLIAILPAGIAVAVVSVGLFLQISEDGGFFLFAMLALVFPAVYTGLLATPLYLYAKRLATPTD